MSEEFGGLPESAPWWARWIVANWRTIWLQASTWFLGLITFLAGLPLAVPDLKDYLSGPVFHWLMIACAVSGLVAKFVKQRP